MLWWFAQTTLVAAGLAVAGGAGGPVEAARAGGPACALAGRADQVRDPAGRRLALARARRLARPGRAGPGRGRRPPAGRSARPDRTRRARSPSPADSDRRPSPRRVREDGRLAGLADRRSESPISGCQIPDPIRSGSSPPAPEPSRRSEPGIRDPRSEIRICDPASGSSSALWLAGSVAVVARRAVAVVRFRRGRWRGRGRPRRGWSEEARAIGDRLGVRPPPILVVPGVATPLLWCLGRPRLILPEAADRSPGRRPMARDPRPRAGPPGPPRPLGGPARAAGRGRLVVEPAVPAGPPAAPRGGRAGLRRPGRPRPARSGGSPTPRPWSTSASTWPGPPSRRPRWASAGPGRPAPWKGGC